MNPISILKGVGTVCTCVGSAVLTVTIEELLRDKLREMRKAEKEQAKKEETKEEKEEPEESKEEK